jgi:hypothetical protein
MVPAANCDRRDPAGDSMRQHFEFVRGVTAPPLILDRIRVLSDGECMRRLAHAVKTHHSGH